MGCKSLGLGLHIPEVLDPMSDGIDWKLILLQVLTALFCALAWPYVSFFIFDKPGRLVEGVQIGCLAGAAMGVADVFLGILFRRKPGKCIVCGKEGAIAVKRQWLCSYHGRRL